MAAKGIHRQGGGVCCHPLKFIRKKWQAGIRQNHPHIA